MSHNVPLFSFHVPICCFHSFLSVIFTWFCSILPWFWCIWHSSQILRGGLWHVPLFFSALCGFHSSVRFVLGSCDFFCAFWRFGAISCAHFASLLSCLPWILLYRLVFRYISLFFCLVLCLRLRSLIISLGFLQNVAVILLYLIDEAISPVRSRTFFWSCCVVLLSFRNASMYHIQLNLACSLMFWVRIYTFSLAFLLNVCCLCFSDFVFLVSEIELVFLLWFCRLCLILPDSVRLSTFLSEI